MPQFLIYHKFRDLVSYEEKILVEAPTEDDAFDQFEEHGARAGRCISRVEIMRLRYDEEEVELQDVEED
jgi:hypothetical protein